MYTLQLNRTFITFEEIIEAHKTILIKIEPREGLRLICGNTRAKISYLEYDVHKDLYIDTKENSGQPFITVAKMKNNGWIVDSVKQNTLAMTDGYTITIDNWEEPY